MNPFCSNLECAFNKTLVLETCVALGVGNDYRKREESWKSYGDFTLRITLCSVCYEKLRDNQGSW